MASKIWLLWLVVALQEAELDKPPAPDQRRSVLFWLIDTCRADHLSVYGHGRRTTPFLERLAAEGVAFESCYSQAPWTKPAMASILTSQYPSVHGSTQLFSMLNSDFVTFPELLRAAGWYTAGFSANPIMGRFSNYNQGFHRFAEAPYMIEGASPMDYASGSAAKIVPHAVKWLESNERHPFFLYMHSLDPHEWYNPAPEFKEKFADPAFEEQYRKDWDKLMKLHEQIVNTCTQETFDQAGVEVGPFIDYGMKLYDADILANDDAIEKLFEHLGEEGHGERMIVVVTADHGVEFFEHGATSLGHSLYNEMIHVPLIFWAPDLLPAGLRFSEPVRSVDIFPTLLDLLGLEIPPGLMGQSLLPWIRDGKATEAREVYSENIEELLSIMNEQTRKYTNGMSVSLIRMPWKLILNLKPRLSLPQPRHELYHIESDPKETTNVADQHPEIVKELEQAILARFKDRAQEPAARPEQVDPEILEALRALGYIR